MKETIKSKNEQAVKAWRNRLECEIVIDKTLISSFETSITILSEILAERDRIYKEYEARGCNPVEEFTTDRGAVNLKPNPLLRQWQELNVTALQYLRELGLSPAGLRKLQGQLPKASSSKLDEFKKEFE